MAKARPKVPPPIREKVLKEFSHRCAVCGADDPHLHHLDENPANNDPLNLLPLCPNCHLTDQHNPTRSHDPKKLVLFRLYKDPSILLPQFEPLFERLRFLDSVEQSFDPDACSERARDLVAFVGQLEMGDYYSKKISELVSAPAWGFAFLLGDPESERRHEESRAEWRVEYQRKLTLNRTAVQKVAVELLRFQNWKKDEEKA